jgi:hypothetical protein
MTIVSPALEKRTALEQRLAEVNAKMRALRDPHRALPTEAVDVWVALYKERQALERQVLLIEAD